MQQLEASTRRSHRIGIVGWFSLALGGIVAVALLLLWLFLADYQNSLPKNLANQIFHAYQSNSAELIEAHSGNLPKKLKDPTQLASYYEKNTDLSNLYFYLGTTENSAELCYEFVAGKDPIATLTLQKTGAKSRFGFPQYEIAKLTSYSLGSYQITAPPDVTLLVDGVPLSEQHTTDAQGTIDNFSVLGKTFSRSKVYEIDDFASIDTLDISSKDHCDCTVIWSEDRRSATVKKQISEEQQAQITEFALAFSKAYSVFATKQNGTRGAVLRLLYPDTPFYNALLLYNNDWGEAYRSDEYKNRVIDNFIRYSPTEFSCDIQFDYVIRFSDGFEKTYPYSMTYYITNQNGSFLLVDMQTKA